MGKPLEPSEDSQGHPRRKPEDSDVSSVLARKVVKASRGPQKHLVMQEALILCQFPFLASAQQKSWYDDSQSWLLISITWELLEVLLPRPRHLTSGLTLTYSPVKPVLPYLPGTQGKASPFWGSSPIWGASHPSKVDQTSKPAF